jgi:hypothetical protein
MALRKLRNISIGEQFDYQIIISGEVRIDGVIYHLCRCRCGNEKYRTKQQLLKRQAKSCGCLKSEITITMNKARTPQNGLSAGREYAAWHNAHLRCKNPKRSEYPRYGGRGITICAGWNTFLRFYADMGPKPSPAHTLERIDNDGHYSCGHCWECLDEGWPANCRWATMSEQCRNRRSARWITANGETLQLWQWCERLNTHKGLILARIAHGWSEQKAVLTPVTRHHRAGSTSPVVPLPDNK